MSVSAFLSLVEIKTKTASVLAFLTGTLFVYYQFGFIRVLQLILITIPCICCFENIMLANNIRDIDDDWNWPFTQLKL